MGMRSPPWYHCCSRSVDVATAKPVCSKARLRPPLFRVPARRAHAAAPGKHHQLVRAHLTRPVVRLAYRRDVDLLPTPRRSCCASADDCRPILAHGTLRLRRRTGTQRMKRPPPNYFSVSPSFDFCMLLGSQCLVLLKEHRQKPA